MVTVRTRILAGLIACFGGLASPQVRAQDISIPAVSNWDTPFSAQLASAGVVPAQTIEVADATFHLSNPYALDESHQIAIAWISVGNRKNVRALYRSNSQCCWRMVDAMTPSHIGKGYHEFDKNVPIDVTVALLRSGSSLGKLVPRTTSENSKATQESLAQKILEMLTIKRDEGTKSGDVILVGNKYLTKEYASWIPLMCRWSLCLRRNPDS
jgi:hypothetical protein